MDEPTVTMLAGTAKAVTPEASNADVPMCVRVASGEMWTDVRLVQPMKASSPIEMGFGSTTAKR